MSTRYTKKNGKGIFADSKGTTDYNIPDNFDLPNCSIEDVDRSLFSLFDKELPFTFKHKSGTKRSPVIFAAGERFAVLRRKRPLRDKSGTLILPLVSIMRTGITQSPTLGAGTAQNQPIVVRQRLSAEDRDYQNVLNKSGINNSDSSAVRSRAAKAVAGQHNDSQENIEKDNVNQGFKARDDHGNPYEDPRKPTLSPDINNNIYEIITIAPPKYYTASYEVTFWTQYTQQMNDMIMAMMSLYQSFSQRTFRLETPKGYWFVAFVDDELSPGNNFDDFTDSERLIRYSFGIKVPAYIVGTPYPGGQSTLRRFISAPILNFGIETRVPAKEFKYHSNIPSFRAKDYLLDDTRIIDESLPGQFVGSYSSPGGPQRGSVNVITGSDSIGGKEV